MAEAKIDLMTRTSYKIKKDQLLVLAERIQTDIKDGHVSLAKQKATSLYEGLVLLEIIVEDTRNDLDITCTSCGKEPGVPRIDNGLPCGTHCAACWNEMVSDCRKKSY